MSRDNDVIQSRFRTEGEDEEREKGAERSRTAATVMKKHEKILHLKHLMHEWYT